MSETLLIMADTAGSLEETLARVARLGDRFELPVCGEETDMVPAAELIDPGGGRVNDFLAGLPESEVSVKATASRFLRSYTARLASPAVAAWALERRVPDVGPGNVRCRLGPHSRATELGLVRADFSCLHDDEAAAAAQSALPANPLLAWLQHKLFRLHLAPLVGQLAQHRLVSEKVLWGDVAAMCAAVFVYWLRPARGRSATLDADAKALLEPAGTPWNGRGSWTVFQLGGEPTSVFVRDSCCVRYRFKDQARCVDCSIIDEDERATRLQELLGS